MPGNAPQSVSSTAPLCILCARDAGIFGSLSTDGKTLYLPYDVTDEGVALATAFAASPPAEHTHPVAASVDPVRARLTTNYLRLAQSLQQVPAPPQSGPDIWAPTRARLTADAEAALAALNAVGGPI